jgi:hypothetical protein
VHPPPASKPTPKHARREVSSAADDGSVSDSEGTSAVGSGTEYDGQPERTSRAKQPRSNRVAPSSARRAARAEESSSDCASESKAETELTRLRKMVEQASAADATAGRPLLSRRAARIKGAKTMRPAELVPRLRELLEATVGTSLGERGWLGRCAASETLPTTTPLRVAVVRTSRWVRRGWGGRIG